MVAVTGAAAVAAKQWKMAGVTNDLQSHQQVVVGRRVAAAAAAVAAARRLSRQKHRPPNRAEASTSDRSKWSDSANLKANNRPVQFVEDESVQRVAPLHHPSKW